MALAGTSVAVQLPRLRPGAHEELRRRVPARRPVERTNRCSPPWAPRGRQPRRAQRGCSSSSLAIAGAFGAIGALPQAAAAARPKVVVIVGPVSGNTDEFRADGRRLARQAKAYGARVITVFSP